MMIPGLAIGKIASTIGIKGFAMIGLGLALAIVMWRTDAISGQRDHEREQRIAAEYKLGVSNASIATLEEALARYIGDGKARRIAGLAALEAQAGKSKALRDQAASTRAMIDTLEPDNQCRTPGFVMGER